MEPALITDVRLLVDRFIGKKWKDFIGAVFESSAFGCARLELFASETKLRSVEPAKVIILSECVSIRTAFAEKDIRVIKLHMKNDSTFIITSTHFGQLKETLSKAAFPQNYVTLQPSPSSSLDSPASVSAPEEHCDRIPILLLPRTMSRNKRLRDGNYDLLFDEDMLKLQDNNVILDSWEYHCILWVATGERCLGFEIEDAGVFECACADPQLAVENFRRFVTFSTVFRPVAKRTQNNYNRNYTPVRTAAPLSQAAIVEDDEECSEANESRASTNRTCDSGVYVSEVHSKFRKPMPQKKGKPREISRAISNSMQELPKEENKGFFKFLRRNSAKHKTEKTRDSFEKNVSSEWLNVTPRVLQQEQQRQESPEFDRLRADIKHAVKHRHESQTPLCSPAPKPDSSIFSQLEIEIVKQFKHLNASERSSIA